MYQRHLLDLAKFVGHVYKLQNTSAEPRVGSRPPSKNKMDFDRWAWDWLNMYEFQISFKKSSSKLRFSLWIINDTGYMGTVDSESLSPLDVVNFKSPQNSKSIIYLIAFDDEWKVDNLVKDFQGLGNESLARKMDSGSSECIKKYDLKDFLNEDSSRKCLEDFAKFSEDNGLGGLLQD